MRVCMVAYTFYEGDNRVRRYAEALAAQGHEVHVFSLRWNNLPAESEVNGVRVFRIQERLLNERHKLDYLWRILRFMVSAFCHISWQHLRKPYQFVHAHSVPDFLVFTALLPRLAGTPVVLDIHDILPEFYASKFKVGKDSLIFKTLRWVEWVCCHFAQHVIIANDLWKERIESRSVSPDRCTTMLNYPDPRLFRVFRPKKSLGKFVIMYPGTIAWHQGLDIAVRAMPMITKVRPDVELQIYGAGSAEREVRELIEQLGVGHCAKVLTPLPLDGVPELVIDADLGIVPKRDEGFGGEAFSTKIFEFMALGVPALISRTRIDQYYFNEDTVSFFESGNERDFAEKVIALANHPEERERLRKNSLEFVKGHSWAIHQKTYLGLIARLRSECS